MDRPEKDRYFLDIALSVATRSTCTRRKFGAVIVKDSTIVGTGYNGTARGVVNCYEVGCIKDEMESPKGQRMTTVLPSTLKRMRSSTAIAVTE